MCVHDTLSGADYNLRADYENKPAGKPSYQEYYFQDKQNSG